MNSKKISRRRSPPVADASKKLSQMAEFRNEAKAAQDFRSKDAGTAEETRAASPLGPTHRFLAPGPAGEKLQQSLDDFQGEHPQVFKGAESESRQAQQSMDKAAESLQASNANSPTATQKATQDLEKLSSALQNQSADRQLADAYKLKKMLDQEIRTFDQRSKSDSNISEEQVQQTVKEARETLNQLKNLAEQEPTRDAFKQPLRDSLTGQNKVDLDAKLNRLERPKRLEEALEGGTKEAKAADASQALGKVSKAFDESQPGSCKWPTRGWPQAGRTGQL